MISTLNAGNHTITLSHTEPFVIILISASFVEGTSTVKLSDADHTLNGHNFTYDNLVMEPLTAPRTITLGDAITVNGTFISGSSAANQVSFVKGDAASDVTNAVTSYYCASNGGIANITCIPCGTDACYDSSPAPGSTINMTTVEGTNTTSTLTVSETGDVQLNVTGITVTGTDAGKFTVSPAGFTIADGGAAKNVTVTCDGSAAGVFDNATLEVTHSATGSPATYPLGCTVTSGSVVVPPDAPDPVATVINVTSTPASDSYSIGSVIAITVHFSEPVWVKGTPLLVLRTGPAPETAWYSGGGGTDVLTFLYTVAAGDDITVLDYWSEWALELNGGRIYNNQDIDADQDLFVSGEEGSLGYNTTLGVLGTIYPVYRFYSPNLSKYLWFFADLWEKLHTGSFFGSSRICGENMMNYRNTGVAKCYNKLVFK